MNAELEEYRRYVENREGKLADYATRSFETTYLDGITPEERYNHIFTKTSIFNISRNKYRTPFQYDRDRILHSNYFLRLAQKTQLLTSGETGIVEDRLKHTLRVSQIARSIAAGLNLNEDLVEAIALGHDVGHTPFGHIGEIALDTWIKKKIEALDYFPRQRTLVSESIEPILTKVPKKSQDSFKEFFTFGNDKNEKFFMHGRNSFRCLAFKRKRKRDYTNLTREVLFGIWRHSTKNILTDKDFIFTKELGNDRLAEISGKNCTLEAQVVRYADDISWVATDLVEGNRIGVIKFKEVDEAVDGIEIGVERDDKTINILYDLFRGNIGPVYTYFISDIIEQNKETLKNKDDKLRFSQDVEHNLDIFKKIIEEKIRSPSSSLVRGDKVKCAQITALCDWYYKNYDQLINDLKRMQDRDAFPYEDKWDFKTVEDDEIARICLIVDFIATLTDLEAEELSKHMPLK